MTFDKPSMTLVKVNNRFSLPFRNTTNLIRCHHLEPIALLFKDCLEIPQRRCLLD
jgi:hypothetical protein